MFDTLIESSRKSDRKKAFGLSFASMLVHSAIAAGAVFATLSAGEALNDNALDTTMVFIQEQKQQEEPKVVQMDVPLKGFQTVVAPAEIPTEIPPINLEERFDPKDYSGTGVEGGIGTGMTPSADQVFLEAVVEERPEFLSGPQPPYPELLRQAGIQGTVLLEAIIDTLGRAEPGSIKVVSSPNPGFNDPAVSTLRRALFRPARVHGRAVRVLIRLPIVFKLQGAR